MLLSPKKTPNKSQSSPDLHTEQDSGIVANVTKRKRKQPVCELTLAIADLSAEFKKTIGDLRAHINTEFLNINMNIGNLREEFNTLSTTSSQIQAELKELRTEYSTAKLEISSLSAKHDDLSQAVTELKSTVNFNSANWVDSAKRIADLEMSVRNSAASSVALLESKIDVLEQQARQCNIELGNIPEKRGENLISVLESIALAINIPLAKNDVVALHRVPHAHAQNNRPKNIIVKFASRLLRDNLLSAYRLSKGLTSDRIGFSGTPCRIYINEHLTLRNKDLFRKCREAAKANKFRYVWIRNATVLVKEADDSATFAIRTEADISSKITPKKHPENIADN